MVKRLILPLVSVVWIGGCAPVPPDAGFNDVQNQVHTRIGHDVVWRRDGDTDARADQAVKELLVQPLTADAAVQVALLNNRRLQATYEDLGVAQAEVVQAGLLKNPVFDASAGFIVGGGSPELTFSVAQDFLEVFFIPLRRAVAEADFERAKLKLSAAVLDMDVDARAGYYRLVADQQMLEMHRQVVDATAASYEAKRKLHEAGNIRDLDLHNEKALYDQARLDLASAQAAVVDSRERLNRLMGLWGEQATQWTVPQRLPDVPDEAMDLSGLETKAVENSLDLAMARQEIVAFGQRLGLTKATALIPSLELGAEAKREDHDWDVGPSVSLPIPLFDQGQARVAAAQAELRRRQQAYIATAVELRSHVRSARQRLLTTRRTAEFYRAEILPQRDQIVRETLLQYNAMQVGVFQLLFAKQQQINAAQSYVESLHTYWMARSELDAMLQGRMVDSMRSGALPMTTMPGMAGTTDNTGGH
ncbi:MAG: TolC family protein [Planctomycetes bacterium]|nr:TolC family protein [Planctomycetota bacterium]